MIVTANANGKNMPKVAWCTVLPFFLFHHCCRTKQNCVHRDVKHRIVFFVWFLLSFLPSKQQNTMLHDSYLSAEVFSAFLSRRDGFLCKHLSMIAILFPQQVKFSFENAFSREANR